MRTTKKITLQPFESKHISGMYRVKGPTKKVNAITEAPTKSYSHYACTAPSFATMDQGSSRLSINIRNISCKVVTIKAKTTVATLCAANIILPMLAPKISQEGTEGSKKESQEKSEENEVTQEKCTEEGYNEFKCTGKSHMEYHEFQGVKPENEGDTV